MTGLRNKLLLALAMSAAGVSFALAQTDSGAPRQLDPGGFQAAPAPGDGASPPAEPEPAQPSVQAITLAAPEGPVAGTLTSGSLGADMWGDSARSGMEALLQNAPAASVSPTAKLLLRKVLLTPAPPPSGASQNRDMPISFNGLRLSKLLDGAQIDDAAGLASLMDLKQFPDAARLQADSLLYAGWTMDACGDHTARRNESADGFWVELRTYCFAVAKDSGSFDLTRSLLEVQAISDPASLVLLDGVNGAKLKNPATPQMPTSLDVRMMAQLNLPMNAGVAALGPSADMVIMRSRTTPRELRIAAATRLYQSGALWGAALGTALDLVAFKAEDLVGASAMAPREAPFTGLARLRAAVKTSGDPGARAELIHTAFEIGVQQRRLSQVASVFANDAAVLMPSPDWSNWASVMAYGLIAAEKFDAAKLWLALINDMPPDADTLNRVQLALSLASPPAPPAQEPANPDGIALPAPMPRDGTQQALSWLADQSLAAQDPTLSRAILTLGVYDALGLTMPPEVRSRVPSIVMLEVPGRRPAPAMLARIDKAAQDGNKGELALSVISAIGPQGPGDMNPAVVVDLVRALKRAGIGDAAQSLALEAVLARSVR